MKRPTTPLLLALLIGLLSLTLTACKSEPAKTNEDGTTRLQVVTTTTMLEDLAADIAGPDADVKGIMKPGGDPHLYRPTPGDAKLIARSGLVVTNGLQLEGWIDDLVRNAGGDAQVVVAAKGIDPLKDPLKTNYPDPHVWHDVAKWKLVAANVRDAFIEADPAHKEGYAARGAALIKRLDALDAWVKEQVESVPEGRRVLITSHDAFQYYGKAYGFEVVAVQGVSTESEAGARDVARIVDIVRERKIPALFVETSVNPKLIEQISRETGATIGGKLYSDSLGAKAPDDTYEGMIRTNTTLICAALKRDS